MNEHDAAPTRDEVLAARAAVRAARTQYRAGTLTFDELVRVADHYLDLIHARAQALGFRLRRPARAAVLR